MTDCRPCLDYLARRRQALLPHIGRQVVATGKTPTQIWKQLTARYHQLGHPTTVVHEIKPDTSEFTNALRRLGKTKRPLDGPHGR